MVLAYPHRASKVIPNTDSVSDDPFVGPRWYYSHIEEAKPTFSPPSSTNSNDGFIPTKNMLK